MGDQLTAEQRQREYYERTASHYNAAHVQAGDEHSIALDYIAQLARVVEATTVLDVGSGTGRGVRYLAERRPDLRVTGIEPVAGLRAEGELLGTTLLDGSGQDMPFPDGSFDLVMATGVLHHVPEPAVVVAEMMRVARLGVMISDSNRFGQGHPLMRAAKIAMCATGTWRTYNQIRTRGKGYMESEGDGIFYSYSVFDSKSAVSRWAEHTFVIPTQGAAQAKFGTLMGATHGLLVGLRRLGQS